MYGWDVNTSQFLLEIAMDAARSTLQGAHYDVKISYLLPKLGIKKRA